MKRERGRVLAIKDQIETGSYRVDAHVVADAIVTRMIARREALRAAGSLAQNECSKPLSSSSESTKDTPGGPSSTEPTQVSWGFAPRHC